MNIFFFRKLRNREAAQLSRDKKKAQFNILSGMVHGLRKEVCTLYFLYNHWKHLNSKIFNF